MNFYKYHGTGNDFIMIDNRDLWFPKEKKLIANLCQRHLGIGADGLILLENFKEADFRMIYYNADGCEGTMCGNGGRCVVSFAKFLKIIESETKFISSDGFHNAEISGEVVKLKMIDVQEITQISDCEFELFTGSPHYVKFVENIDCLEVFHEGRKIRNAYPHGINVNFVEKISFGKIFVRTYERGVEDETFSCGTGVTASALIYMLKNSEKFPAEIHVETRGGNLKVYAENFNNQFKNIWLEGAAIKVFEGKI